MSLHIFDLDKTLLNGDSSALFCQFLYAKGLVDQSYIKREADLRCSDYVIEDYIALQLESLLDLKAQETEKLGVEFTANILCPLIYPQGRALIAQLQMAGEQVLIISATVSFIVAPVAKELGVDDFLAIELQANGYRYSDHIQGVASYGIGKVTRFKQWLKQANVNAENSYFYSDSMGDLPLLSEVTNPIVTNPEPLLHKIAVQREWPVLQWSL